MRSTQTVGEELTRYQQLDLQPCRLPEAKVRNEVGDQLNPDQARLRPAPTLFTIPSHQNYLERGGYTCVLESSLLELDIMFLLEHSSRSTEWLLRVSYGGPARTEPIQLVIHDFHIEVYAVS